MSTDARCKACDQPMTEGRAYELGSHRWHVNCFRCSNCHDQLTAHTNMLVLGDGTLVCANCSYECAVCQKKIKDMAVLTNDQAFCAACFVCRNCKKRIDDLQYARTSQGIFCMTCHTALLARKRQLQQLKKQQRMSDSKSSSKASLASRPNFREIPRDRDLPVEPDGASRKVPRKQLAPSAIRNSANGSTISTEVESPVSASPLDNSLPSSAYTTSASTPVMETVEKTNVEQKSSLSLQGFNSTTELSMPDPEFSEHTKPPPIVHSAPSSANLYHESNLSAELPMLSGSNANWTSSVTTSTDNTSVEPSTQSTNRQSDAHAGSVNSHEEYSFLSDPFDSTFTPLPVVPNTPLRSRKQETRTPDPYNRSFHQRYGSGQILTSPDMGSPNQALSPDSIAPSPAQISLQPALQDLSNEESSFGDSLGIPRRSQLRPVSPARPERSPFKGLTPNASLMANSGSSSLPLGASPNPSLQHSQYHASSISDKSMMSPTQAAAPPQTPRSPFNRWWHRHTDSQTSQKSVGSTLMGHKRSTSINSIDHTPGMGVPMISPPLPMNGPILTLEEALVQLSFEQRKAKVAEQRANELNTHLEQVTQRDNLQSELNQLNDQVSKLQNEQRLLILKNKQLKDMNTELEKQTLEKFGPNSLWGSSLNPPQTEFSNPSPSTSSKDLASIAPAMAPLDSAPMVTRLDDPIETATPAQAQFLPLKSAKQWFFRRPNKVSNQSNPNGSFPTGSNAQNQLQGHNGGSNGNTVQRKPPYNPTGNGSGTARPSLLGDSLQHRTHVDMAPVPTFVTRCFAEIEKRGLDTEGIYRKPGSKSQIDAILEQFGPAGDAKLGEDLLGGEIQAVSSAVKQYLRALAVPVIAYDSYDTFVAAGNSRNSEVLRKAVLSLPHEHRETLKAVVSHLTLVAEHEENNLMNIRNLAMVFAPTLARDEFGDREIPDMQARNEATQMLISNPSIVLDPIDELS